MNNLQQLSEKIEPSFLKYNNVDHPAIMGGLGFPAIRNIRFIDEQGQATEYETGKLRLCIQYGALNFLKKSGVRGEEDLANLAGNDKFANDIYDWCVEFCQLVQEPVQAAESQEAFVEQLLETVNGHDKE